VPIKLEPREGRSHLPWGEIIARCADVFGYMMLDRNRGRSQADQIIDRLKEMDAGQEAIDAMLDRRERAATVTLGDEAGSREAFLSFLLMPDREILVAFLGVDHARESLPLLKRLAERLDYDMIDA